MTAHNYPTASLWRRLAALAYDSLIIIALYILVGFILQGLYVPLHHGEPLGELSFPVVLIIIFWVCFFYYSASWRKGGQTIGMKAWHIKLINLEAKPMQLSQYMLRTATGFFSMMAFGIGFLWPLFDPQQRSWHDITSLTRVVYLPKGME